MKTPFSSLIEHAAGTLGKDLSRLQKAGLCIAEYLAEDAGKMVKRARYKWRNGANALEEVEEKITSSVQARPLAYVLVTLGLATVVCLKILLDRQNQSQNDSQKLE